MRPLQFVYTHLHDAIRDELDALWNDVLVLGEMTSSFHDSKNENGMKEVTNGESGGRLGNGEKEAAQERKCQCEEKSKSSSDVPMDATVASPSPSKEHESREKKLSHLRERYRFLKEIYRYHSSVEDEVIYPFLESKVRNVTSAYSVEHEDEEQLLEELSTLLLEASSNFESPGFDSTVSKLTRKVEEVHTTLRNHLAKEERQLFPLLLEHFSDVEQAELVAHFLCCIPISAVSGILVWWKRKMTPDEQEQLAMQVKHAVENDSLKQVIFSWLNPDPRFSEKLPSQVPGTPESLSEFTCCGQHCKKRSRTSREHLIDHESLCCKFEQDLEDVEQNDKPPLREILYFHRAIRSALSSFVEQLYSLCNITANGKVEPSQLNILAARHRFIRDVCLFHAASEDEVVFPALQRLAKAGNHKLKENGQENDKEQIVDCNHHKSYHFCGHHHVGEIGQFEKLGRLLGDVRACVRRDAHEVFELTKDLSEAADKLSCAMKSHMAEEERNILPVLMNGLCVPEQRYLAWRVLCAMPLRLLERVMPWIVAKLDDEDAREWLINIKRAAPSSDAVLVRLLEVWAERGFAYRKLGRKSSDDPALFQNETCGPHLGCNSCKEGEKADLQSASTAPVSDAHAYECDGPALKRIKVTRAESRCGANLLKANLEVDTTVNKVKRHKHYNPIDHIFQFHKALRREIKELELAAVDLEASIHSISSWEASDGIEKAMRDVEVKFQFLRGIYRAHSTAEDEIVFPALEAKETLENVSHSYALDHAQEEELFDDLGEVVAALGDSITRAKGNQRDLRSVQNLASKFARMTAAVRAGLETHVRAEEKELWPLFAEHFSVEEQEHLVGVIIGRTGAEVLHTMLSWVQRSMTIEERTAMMASLKSASKSTAFEQWLDAAVEGGKPSIALEDCETIDKDNQKESTCTPRRLEQRNILAEVARYLAKEGSGKSYSNTDPDFLAADATDFRPGWEDIFRMNQKQLEASVRRMSSDPTLDPQHKAYLIQNLMASRYIVAQQKRIHDLSPSFSNTPTSRDSEIDQSELDDTIRDSAEPLENDLSTRKVDACTSNGGIEKSTNDAFRHYHDASLQILGCKHYQRKALLVSPCCNTEFVCRICHDEAIPDHKFDRYRVTEMRCMECGTRQPVSNNCGHCGIEMAKYYCNICHLFDDDSSRPIYHCPFCNFCRRGKGLGIDSFHCMNCNACMSLELQNKHRCTEHALSGTCPVCSDPLFESKAPIKELPCGHFMHSHCFAAYTKYSYACPICSKSLGDMSVYWKMIDSLLESEALPPEVATRKQNVQCNDCGSKSTVPFHWVYHKCSSCRGYNTRLLS